MTSEERRQLAQRDSRRGTQRNLKLLERRTFSVTPRHQVKGIAGYRTGRGGPSWTTVMRRQRVARRRRGS